MIDLVYVQFVDALAFCVERESQSNVCALRMLVMMYR